MDIIAELRAVLPPVFLGSKINELTGHAIAWGTVHGQLVSTMIGTPAPATSRAAFISGTVISWSLMWR